MTVATKDSYVAVHACGCITAWISTTHSTPAELGRFMAEHVREGKTVEHVALDAIRNDSLMFPRECPHTPKGWERPEPQPYKPRVRWTKVSRGLGDARRVAVVTPWSHGYPVGDARRLNGKWWITEGWFNWDDEGANKGDENRTPAEVEGPFDTQREAGERLAEIAMAKSRARYVEINGEEAAQAMLEYEERLA